MPLPLPPGRYFATAASSYSRNCSSSRGSCLSVSIICPPRPPPTIICAAISTPDSNLSGVHRKVLFLWVCFFVFLILCFFTLSGWWYFIPLSSSHLLGGQKLFCPTRISNLSKAFSPLCRKNDSVLVFLNPRLFQSSFFVTVHDIWIFDRKIVTLKTNIFEWVLVFKIILELR